MIFLDGVDVGRPDGTPRFRWVTAPSSGGLGRTAVSDERLSLTHLGSLFDHRGATGSSS